MSDYVRPLRFGVSINPGSAELPLARTIAQRADALGLDLIGIQDHPYQQRFLESRVLIADLLARTERPHIFRFKELVNSSPAKSSEASCCG
jgi:alkanesulfonate monooxygenase SsuD/methylene tetrahydromethanopterin reductase-like flavin-dependent oxidoreductase (luciferase family)